MNSVTVFCGSSLGNDVQYEAVAYLLGQLLAKQNITLIYGGAKVGLMGAVADGALSAEGKVIGIIPAFLKKKEIVHAGISELIEVDTMHARKMKMEELCEGVIALPGGFGTLEELFEMITWAQLGLHQKPVAILNIGGFYDLLQGQINHMVQQGFLKSENRNQIIFSDDQDDLLLQMRNYIAPDVQKWITKKSI